MLRGLALPALATLGLVSACGGSPETGGPEAAPVTSTPFEGRSAPTRTPSGVSTSAWSSAELAAVEAAKARYLAARAAVNEAVKRPGDVSASALALAGNGGTWLPRVEAMLAFSVKNGWYETGDARISMLAVRSVKLDLAQPEVRLTSCIDSSAVVSRYRSNSKPIPVVSDNGDRHRFESRLIYTKSAETGRRMWILVDEQTTKTC